MREDFFDSNVQPLLSRRVCVNIGQKTVGNLLSGSLYRVARKVSITGGGLGLTVAEELAE